MNSNVIEVKIRDLIWEIVSKWKSIFVFAIIGAVILAGVDYSQKKSQESRQVETSNMDIESYQIDTVEKNRAKAYMILEEQLQGQSEYMLHSPLMQLNPNSFYVGTLRYYIQSDESVKAAIGSAYDMSLTSEVLYEEISQALKLDDVQTAYASELIDTKATYCDFLFKTVNVFGEATAETTQYVTINVYADNESDCETLLETVDEFVGKQTNDIRKKVGEHSLEKISRECSNVSSKELVRFQTEYTKDVNSNYTAMNNIKKEMTDSEQAYIAFYRRQFPATNNVVATISLKKVLIGFVLGASLAVMVYIILYILNGKIRKEDQAQEMFGIPQLGVICMREKTAWGFIDRWIEKMRYAHLRLTDGQNATELLALNLKLLSKRNQIKSLCIVGCGLTEETKQVIKHLQNSSKGSDLQIVEGGAIVYDAKALEKAVEVGTVVLLESVGVSAYLEIQEELEICKTQGIRVLGLAMVEK